MRPLVLLIFLAPALAQEEALPFGKEPVACKPIECEVRVPNGWKVTQDHTGMSALGGGMGFVISREPLLHDEKTFGAAWEAKLTGGGIKTTVARVRAGRYKAFKATWEPKAAPGHVVEVYRIHVPEHEMLYNLSFSAPKAADRAALVATVLKSFKCTSKKPKLAFQQMRFEIGSAGTFKLPEGFEVKKDMRWRGDRYVRMRKGYKKPEEAGVIYTVSFPAGARLPTGGTTSKGEDVNRFILSGLTQRGMKFSEKMKTKPATYSGFKGAATTGQVIGTEGEIYELYLWTGKSKRTTASVVLIIHERELRVHKKYFTTVLKTFKAKR
ncbi:MAG: hypothetical protein ACYTGZ_04045 [Planctomycetota bacterium]|jgi:hypothetical protein